jgi:hypothetical protein
MFKSERVNNAIIIALVAFFIGSCLTGVELSTPPVQPCHEATESNCADHKNQPGGIITAFVILGEFLERHDGAITAIATIAIAAFTGTLWYATKKMMEGGESQMAIAREAAEAAKISADAAMLQAKAAIAAQLPVIELREYNLFSMKNMETNVGDHINGGFSIPEFCKFSLKIFNVGKTIARPIFYSTRWQVAHILPEQPEYTEFYPFAPGTIIRPDDAGSQFIAFNFQLSENDREDIKCQNKFLWVYGCIKYHDFMGDLHHQGFCAKWMGLHPIWKSPADFALVQEIPEEYLRSY